MTAATLAWREMVEKQGSSGLVLSLLQEPALNVIYTQQSMHIASSTPAATLESKETRFRSLLATNLSPHLHLHLHLHLLLDQNPNENNVMPCPRPILTQQTLQFSNVIVLHMGYLHKNSSIHPSIHPPPFSFPLLSPHNTTPTKTKP
jgi:hypothetical protein